MPERCPATCKNGSRCSTAPHHGGVFCYFHDPLIPKETRIANCRHGGKATTGIPKPKERTGDQLLHILSTLLTRFLAKAGDTVTGEVIDKVCELAKTQAYVYAQMCPEEAMEVKRPGFKMAPAVMAPALQAPKVVRSA